MRASEANIQHAATKVTNIEDLVSWLRLLVSCLLYTSSSGIQTLTSFIPQTILMAISCGAVFMGANTYIGNAPNFMVRSIAEENGIKMPSFFGYMLWSLSCLIPVFLIDMLIFFL